MLQTDKIDVIGDIHGMQRTLSALLDVLGWRRVGGSWKHPEGRHLVQVGDLVDRGPDSLGVAETLKQFCDDGVGTHVLGNHEFNAIAWFVPMDPQDPSAGYVRSRIAPHHKAFHTTLDEIGRAPERWETIEAWLRHQPLAAERAGIRFIHAAWIPTWVALLPPNLRSDDTVRRCSRIGDLGPAIDVCLKGPGKRPKFAWWETYAAEAPLVCFGHYWFTGLPQPAHSVGRNTICLDYSCGRGGPLVAWRHPENVFVSVRNLDL